MEEEEEVRRGALTHLLVIKPVMWFCQVAPQVSFSVEQLVRMKMIHSARVTNNLTILSSPT